MGSSLAHSSTTSPCSHWGQWGGGGEEEDESKGEEQEEKREAEFESPNKGKYRNTKRAQDNED